MADFYKMNSNEIEARLSRNDAYSKKLKKQFYDERMDRVKEYGKNINSQAQKDKFINQRRQTILKYNKYSGNNHKF